MRLPARFDMHNNTLCTMFETSRSLAHPPIADASRCDSVIPGRGCIAAAAMGETVGG
jgi:hypothetical protein